jgi:hypothetical protein
VSAPIPADVLAAVRAGSGSMRATATNGRYVLVSDLVDEIERLRDLGLRADITYAEAARAVCGYCDGHHPPFQRVVAGPNTAGNYIHERRGGLHGQGEAALCAASGLWSLRVWKERGGLPHFITEE